MKNEKISKLDCNPDITFCSPFSKSEFCIRYCPQKSLGFIGWKYKQKYPT